MTMVKVTITGFLEIDKDYYEFGMSIKEIIEYEKKAILTGKYELDILEELNIEIKEVN